MAQPCGLAGCALGLVLLEEINVFHAVIEDIRGVLGPMGEVGGPSGLVASWPPFARVDVGQSSWCL